MNNVKIEWREYSEGDGRDVLCANALGYYLLLEPVRKNGLARAEGYSVTYTEAGNPNETWPIEPTNAFAFEMPSPSQEAAKQAATVWLAKQIAELRDGEGGQLQPAAVFEITSGLRYGLQFMNDLLPFLSDHDAVETVPAVAADGHSGLCLRNHFTGYGVRILSCSRAEHVAMSTGTLSELDDADDDRTSTTYFHKSEIANYAKVAAKMYLAGELVNAARMYHDTGASKPARAEMRPQEVLKQPQATTLAPGAPAPSIEVLDLLTKLVDSDVGRDTLWKLSKGQGTATADGKAWLAAADTVARLRASLKQ